MRKKFDRDEIENIENLGEVLDDKFRENEIPRDLGDRVGCCSQCSHMHYHKTRLEDEVFLCERYVENGGRSIHLNLTDPIAVCSTFSRRGAMTLWDMKDLAWKIELPKKVPGFNRNEYRKRDD